MVNQSKIAEELCASVQRNLELTRFRCWWLRTQKTHCRAVLFSGALEQNHDKDVFNGRQVRSRFCADDHPRSKYTLIREACDPPADYSASRRPRLTRRQFWGIIVRTIGYISTALICSALVRHLDHTWSFAIRLAW